MLPLESEFGKRNEEPIPGQISKSQGPTKQESQSYLLYCRSVESGTRGNGRLTLASMSNPCMMAGLDIAFKLQTDRLSFTVFKHPGRLPKSEKLPRG